MWLPKAVGSIHGQQQFTFALERNKTYTIGRSKECDIRFESRHVRPKEGTLEVGDWDPNQRTKAPELKWRVEPKKSGKTVYKILAFAGDDEDDDEKFGSTNREDYTVQENDSTGCVLEESGAQGIELGDDSWFVIVWEDMVLQYDKMKDQPVETRDTLRRYCMTYTEAFDLNDPPTYVLSEKYTSNHHNNYAVCYGIRIITPKFLEDLLLRLTACWKSVADHQDSFCFPDGSAGVYQPILDTALPNTRGDLKSWLPDPRRRRYFQGWEIMALRGKGSPAEKRWLTAMGATWSEVDIVTKPLSSPKEFTDRISKWMEKVQAQGQLDKALIIHFSGVKEGVGKAGVNWNNVVAASCQQIGICLVSGSIVWGSIKLGGPREFIENAAPLPPAVALPATNAVPATEARSPTRAIRSTRAHPVPEVLEPAIPSTFPEESVPLPAVSPVKPAERAPSPEKPQPAASSSTQNTVKKPLKRRAGKAVEPVSFPIIEETPPTANGDAEEIIPDSDTGSQSIEAPPSAQRASGMDIDSVALTQTQQQQTQPARVSRLKRRVGTSQPTQSIFSYQQMSELPPIKDEETPAEIRELYEQTKKESQNGPATKRARIVSGESVAAAPIGTRTRGTSRASSRAPSIPPGDGPGGQAQAEGEDVQMSEPEEDFVQKTLRKAAQTKRERVAKAAMPPPEIPPPATKTRRERSPSEEAIETVEEPTTKKRNTTATSTKQSQAQSAKTKSTQNQNTELSSSQVTKDEAFLTAITKASKSKKAIDELDKEFNQLRIPKPGTKGAPSGGIAGNGGYGGYEAPDYKILDDFDDDLRGNFIEIVRKDLFRKDQPRVASVVEGVPGKPNFKKFKKKEIIRREPVQLVLVGRNLEDAEMGEPYWNQSQSVGKKGKNPSSTQALHGGDEDTLPLLPKSRRRLLDQDEDGDADLPPPTAKRRGGGTTAKPTESQSTRTQPSQSQPSASRKTRASSITSEVSSVGGTSTRGASRKPPARGKGKNLIVVDESEEEGVEFTPSAIGSRKTGTSGSRSTPAGSGGRKESSTASATIGRRRLLPVDDDEENDGAVFKSLAKKRRLG